MSAKLYVLGTISDPEEGATLFLDASTPNLLVLLGDAGCYPEKLQVCTSGFIPATAGLGLWLCNPIPDFCWECCRALWGLPTVQLSLCPWKNENSTCYHL